MKRHSVIGVSGRGACKHIPLVAVLLVVAAIGIAVTGYVAHLLGVTERERMEHETLARLSELRARLEGELSGTLYIAQGLASFAAINGDLSPGQFRRFAEETAALNSNVRRMTLAPDNVVSFTYPLYGNLDVLGRDLTSDPLDLKTVEEASRRRKALISGPYSLDGGSRTIIARAPILVAEDDSLLWVDRAYRGVATVMVDFDGILTSAGIRAEDGGYQVAIRSVIANGGETGLAGGTVLLGDAALFDADAVRLAVASPAGDWELAATPAGGWPTMSRDRVLALIAGGGATGVMALLAGLAMFAQQRARIMAHQDELTGLPNRRFLEKRLHHLAARRERTNVGFCVFFVDLNHFKPINDTHGHAVGDALLREIGRRLSVFTRETDTVARVGGDEFVVVVPGNLAELKAKSVAERLRDVVCEPVGVGEKRITVRASVGFAGYPDDAGTISGILELADRRMYLEKSNAA
jgi:diguanylate cyclase (GGDEF)-like protein